VNSGARRILRPHVVRTPSIDGVCYVVFAEIGFTRPVHFGSEEQRLHYQRPHPLQILAAEVETFYLFVYFLMVCARPMVVQSEASEK